MNRMVYVSFNGKYFNGTQKQKEGVTVQSLLEENLSKVYNEEIKIHSASRLDKGVSAYAWVFNFWTDSTNISTDKFKYVMNRVLPKYIHIVSCSDVPEDFDARYSVKEKTYMYKINLGEPNPLEDEFAWNPKFKGAKIHRIKEVFDCFVGLHDFSSFCTLIEPDQDCRRIVDSSRVTIEGKYLIIRITAKSFLRHQIRFMVGSAYEVGLGRLPIADVLDALDGIKPIVHKVKAPAEGLVLESTKYIDEEIQSVKE